MNPYQSAKDLFVDDYDLSSYFDSLTFEYAKKSLIDAITVHDTPLVFLLGAPGSGKSFLLNLLTKQIAKQQTNLKIGKFFTHPYFDEKEFLEILLSLAGKNIERNVQTTESLMSQLKKNFSNLEYTIIIDEAQLLHEEQIELIRILSDQKIFQFVLSMHKKEGDFILDKPHFKSRTTKVIEIQQLQDHEVARYIENRLIQNNLSEIASMFTKRDIALINQYAGRNFRSTKKIIRTLFEILNIAEKEDLHKKYKKISERTITMAAIDTGLLDVK